MLRRRLLIPDSDKIKFASFSGTNGIVNTSDVIYSPPGTIAFWGRVTGQTEFFTTTGPYGYSVNFYNPNGANQRAIAFMSNNTSSWGRVFDIRLSDSYTNPNYNIFPNFLDWHFYVCDWTTSESHLYIDNVLYGTAGGSSEARTFYATGIGVYNWWPDSFQYSYCDVGPFRFFNKVLTQQERTAVMNAFKHYNHANLKLELLWNKNIVDTSSSNYQFSVLGSEMVYKEEKL